MAGHRNGRPRRDETRAERMLLRYRNETDPLKRLAAAYDWLRFELGHMARSTVPGGGERSSAIARDIADQLAMHAAAVHARSDGQ
jgi:hypothetical protein